MKIQKTGIIGLACVGCIVAFAAGMKFDQYQNQGNRGDRVFQSRFNQSASNGMRQGTNGRPVLGEIIGKDDKSVTVKTADGGSKIILFSTNTSVSKTSDGTRDDLAVGTTVGVFGTENPDKSITAQNIQINPQFRMSSGSAQTREPRTMNR